MITMDDEAGMHRARSKAGLCMAAVGAVCSRASQDMFANCMAAVGTRVVSLATWGGWMA